MRLRSLYYYLKCSLTLSTTLCYPATASEWLFCYHQLTQDLFNQWVSENPSNICLIFSEMQINFFNAKNNLLLFEFTLFLYLRPGTKVCPSCCAATQSWSRSMRKAKRWRSTATSIGWCLTRSTQQQFIPRRECRSESSPSHTIVRVVLVWKVMQEVNWALHL